MKQEYSNKYGGRPPTIAETLSAGQQYSRDQMLEEDDGLNHEEGGIDLPLYDF